MHYPPFTQGHRLELHVVLSASILEVPHEPI